MNYFFNRNSTSWCSPISLILRIFFQKNPEERQKSVLFFQLGIPAPSNYELIESASYHNSWKSAKFLLNRGSVEDTERKNNSEFLSKRGDNRWNNLSCCIFGGDKGLITKSIIFLTSLNWNCCCFYLHTWIRMGIWKRRTFLIKTRSWKVAKTIRVFSFYSYNFQNISRVKHIKKAQRGHRPDIIVKLKVIQKIAKLIGSLSKQWQWRRRERHQTRGLISKTIAVHVHYKSLYNNVKWANSASSTEHGRRRLIFRIEFFVVAFYHTF